MTVLARASSNLTDQPTMKNSREIDTSQRGQKPLNAEAEEPLPGNAQ
jgi:hypothetical protein